MRSLFLGVLSLSLVTVSLSADDSAERFDLTVRENIFAGFQGDDEAMAKGIKSCDTMLAKNPKHAEAMVWRGSAKVYQAGQAFQKKDVANGMKLWTSGLKEMDEAVKLEPKNIGVRIPRSAVLMQASAGAPEAMAKPLLEKARDDFEAVKTMHGDDLNKIGTHPLGELRMGLADAYRRLGNPEKSRENLTAVTKELPDSKYAKRATEWLAAADTAKLRHSCIGCHTKK